MIKHNLGVGSWGMENLRSPWILVAGSTGWKDSAVSPGLAMFQFVEREEELCSDHMVIGAMEQGISPAPQPSGLRGELQLSSSAVDKGPFRGDRIPALGWIPVSSVWCIILVSF